MGQHAVSFKDEAASFGITGLVYMPPGNGMLALLLVSRPGQIYLGK
jgi:hypothetical protein